MAQVLFETVTPHLRQQLGLHSYSETIMLCCELTTPGGRGRFLTKRLFKSRKMQALSSENTKFEKANHFKIEGYL